MASPDLTFSNDGVSLNVSKLSLGSGWREIWIGYFKEFVAYEYIGKYILKNRNEKLATAVGNL